MLNLYCIFVSVIDDCLLVECGSLSYYLKMHPCPNAQDHDECHKAQVLRDLDSCFSAWCDDTSILPLNREKLAEANERSEKE